MERIKPRETVGPGHQGSRASRHTLAVSLEAMEYTCMHIVNWKHFMIHVHEIGIKTLKTVKNYQTTFYIHVVVYVIERKTSSFFCFSSILGCPSNKCHNVFIFEKLSFFHLK